MTIINYKQVYYRVLCELLTVYDKSRRIGTWKLKPRMKRISIFLPKRLTSQLVALRKQEQEIW